MKFEELLDFIESRMTMSHIYQPLLIRTLVESGGSANLRQLALETDKYDVTLLPAGEGQPNDAQLNDAQLKEIMRKLLADRLRLTLHREKRDLSAFRIVTFKAGARLVDSLNPDGPAGIGGGIGTITVKSVTIADFAGFLQRYWSPLVMDRPVIDGTTLTGRYDFTLRWTPEGGTGEFPDFFTAIEQQLGLKLEGATESVDVLLIDHVERPTEN